MRLPTKIPWYIKVILFFKRKKVSVDVGSMTDANWYVVYKTHRGIVYILDDGELR